MLAPKPRVCDVAFDPLNDYPLGTKRPDLVKTRAGTPLAALTLEALRDGTIEGPVIGAAPETLRLQAEVARAAGRTQLAANLERAAELASVPDDVLLDAYTALRPGRSTAQELELWALRLQELDAEKTAAFVREAAVAYEERGLLADG
jgi:propanediol dehydratase small subunit